jgi:PKD repeat protein
VPKAGIEGAGVKNYRRGRGRGPHPAMLICLGLVVLLTMAAPVSAGLEVSFQGDKILTRTGETSPVITVTGEDIPQDGNITFDITNLAWLVANGTLTDANVEVSDTAVDAIWTRQVEFDGSVYTLNLTSTNNATVAGETVTITFTGAAAGNSAWYCDTGDVEVDLTATRDDTLETSDAIIFLIYVTPGSGGLTIAPGTMITTTDGATLMVITIAGEPVLRNDMITIPLWDLDAYTTGGKITNANVIISDDAAAATWTGNIDEYSILTLTSDGGDTAVDENITITLTGSGGNPWKAGSTGNPILWGLRPDTNAVADYLFAIHIPPPPGYNVTANFTANTTTELAPLAVIFTDTSAGNPDTWSWDFGDGGTSTEQNPTYIYTVPGTYTVSLTASNSYSADTATKYQYIHALNGGTTRADSGITGLTLSTCQPFNQKVTADTSVLPADLIPDQHTLEVQPPADSGFSNITLHASDSIGFTRSGDLIQGNITGVHFESQDIRPPSGFSTTIGPEAAFNFSTDLPYYPCNAVITTTVYEGILPADDAKLQIIASRQAPVAVPIGTAYTVKITKQNFPPTVPVKIHMSVDSGWNGDLAGGPGNVFIWKISEDGNTGQIFPTTLWFTDPGKNLDFHEATSTGMSTFGLSSFTGNNNPFQLVTFAVSSYIAPEIPVNPPAGEQTDTERRVTASPTLTPTATVTPTPPPLRNLTAPLSETVTAKIYTNQEGLVTQETTLASRDGAMTITVPKGVVARGGDGKPLLSISLTPVEKDGLPTPAPAGAVMFAGRAFEIQPDGATFSPGISFSFVMPADTRFSQDFTVMMFDHASGTWQDVPTEYDTGTGLITAQVTRFCCFALFGKTGADEEQTRLPTPEQSRPAPIPAPSQPPTTAMGIFMAFINWIIANPLAAIGIAFVIIALGLYETGHLRRG